MSLFEPDRVQAFQYVTNIVDQVQKYFSCFTVTERFWVEGYVGVVTDLILSEALFDPELKNMEWSKYNVRYGVDSVKGTLSEVMAIAIWNSYSTYESCRMTPSGQVEQIGGEDVYFAHSSWKKNYSGQVKTTHDVTANSIHFKKSWVSYEKVDRLVLVDQYTETLYCLDYPAVKALSATLPQDDMGNVMLNKKELNDPVYRLKQFSRCQTPKNTL